MRGRIAALVTAPVLRIVVYLIVRYLMHWSSRECPCGAGGHRARRPIRRGTRRQSIRWTTCRECAGSHAISHIIGTLG